MQKNILDKDIVRLEKAETTHFDKMSRAYDKNYGYLSKFTQYKIEKKVSHFLNFVDSRFNGKEVKVLEVGCGTGEYTKKFAINKKFHVVATDISSGMLSVAKEKCKKLSGVEFKCLSAYDLSGIADSSIDVVCGFYILHHLDVEKVKKEIDRILKPGGYVYFYEPNLLNPVVFLIKSIPYIKKKAGDSPDELAINPLSIGDYFDGYNVIECKTTEFVPILSSIPDNWAKKIDICSRFLERVPLVNFVGGSVVFAVQKK